ncbi:four helix bundle protein [Endozoicomonas atrinae]|uniref:four helix bundle protein n=1 Tax=Endozoicomonas atrinae TaxID=1333660 RepID=UPI000825A7C3|nr:four helix bundle protein [Endozoicomonas atrinae]
MRFENLRVWQEARSLTKTIYQLSHSGSFSKDFGLRDQICRASVSIMANIAEGFERASQAEYRQFLVIAKGSCGEVRSLLYVAFDAGYIQPETLENLKVHTFQISAMLAALIQRVEASR